MADLKRNDNLIGFQVGRDKSIESTIPSIPPGWEEDRFSLIADLAARLSNLENAIDLKVDSGSIISQLLLTEEAALLTADKIAILGEVTFLDYWRDVSGKATDQIDPSITQIRGGTIRTEKVTNWDFDSYLNLDAGKQHRDLYGNLRSNHNSSQTYLKDEFVYSNGYKYFAKQNVPVGISIGNTNYWEFDNIFLRAQNSVRIFDDGSFIFGESISENSHQIIFDVDTGALAIHGSIAVGDFIAGTGISLSDQGLFNVIDLLSSTPTGIVHAFSLIDNYPVHGYTYNQITGEYDQTPAPMGILDKNDVMIGRYFGTGEIDEVTSQFIPGKGMLWDDSTETLIVKGSLIVGNLVTGSGMAVNDLGLFLANNGNWVYGMSLTNNVTVNGGVLDKFDMMVGDYFNNKGMLWDDSASLFTIKGELIVGNLVTGSGMYVGENGLFLANNGVWVHGFSLSDGINIGTGILNKYDVMIGNYFGGSGILYDASTGIMDFAGISLTMVENTDALVQEGDSLTRLVDLVIDNLVDGTYGRIKSSALSVDGFIVMDHVVDGTYGKIKVSALTADGLIILDHVVDGTYSKVKTTSIQAGEIRLDKVIHNDTDRFISSTHISAGKLVLSATSTSFATGYDPSVKTVTIRATTAPTQRTDGSALRVGDLWINSASGQGNKPYNWGGSSWIQAYTAIDGAHITTGTINANRIYIGSNRISDVSANADNTASNTSYNTNRVNNSSLNSGYVLTVDGNINVESAGDINFYYGSTKAGNLTNALLAFIVESFGALQLKGGLMTQIWAQGQDVAYFSSSQITAYRQVAPNSDNTRSLGLTGTRWSHFFTHHINCSETNNIYLGKSSASFVLRYWVDGSWHALQAYIAPS